MIEPTPTGHVRAKMRNRTGSTVRQQATGARKAFHEAIQATNATTKAGGDPEAVAAALEPFLKAAEALSVRLGDG